MNRFRLAHGPIDCLCSVEGAPSEMRLAQAQAELAFQDVLPGLCAELRLLRAPIHAPNADQDRAPSSPLGPVARRMHAAVLPLAGYLGDARPAFITAMAAVAGAVADHLLSAMIRGRVLRRALVNNGGDIAIHLMPGEVMRVGMVVTLADPALDAILTLHRSAGVATSGRACKGQGGRSFSLGIADAVTVLAPTAAMADAAATVIGNAVDLPAHPAIIRRPADDIDPDSDLEHALITWEVGSLAAHEVELALMAGRLKAQLLRAAGLIDGAACVLRGRLVTCGSADQQLEAA